MPTYPLLAGAVHASGRRLDCRLPDRTVQVEAPAALLRQLLPLCDGRNSLGEINKRLALHWSPRDVNAFIRALTRLGVVVDADQVASHVWKYVRNPRQHGAINTGTRAYDLRLREERRRPRSGRVHTVPRFGLRRLLERRETLRTFSGASVALRDTLKLVWAAYGTLERQDGYGPLPRRAVPSAGGLYPLVLHLVVLKDSPELRKGIYLVAAKARGRIALNRLRDDTEAFFRAVIDPTILLHAYAAIVVCGRFAAIARRYGSRSLLYVPLEAGHAAQNALLAAGEAGLASAEIGGFFEERMRVAIGAPRDATPLTMVVFGERPSERDLEADRQRLAVEFRWVEHSSGPYRLPYELASARVQSQPWWSWGRARSPKEAYDKAVAEAQERRGLEAAKDVYEARLNELHNPVAPPTIVSYSDAQHRAAGFAYRRFNPALRCHWKNGSDYVSGTTTPVPAECVYYSIALPQIHRPLTEASSSGVAAYPDAEGAVRRAALELVERDAFMLAWLCRLDTPRIVPRSLPADLRARMRRLQSIGFRVVAKDISRELAPAVLVFAQDRGRCITAVGAAAGFNPEEIVSAALMEVETALARRLSQAAPARRVRPEQVRETADHGDLYAQKRYFRRADFLAGGGRSVSFRHIGGDSAKSWGDLLDNLSRDELRLIAVDVTPPHATVAQGRVPLHVYRALIPGLVPVSFGFGTEPLAMPRLLERAKSRPPEILRALARTSAMFPHPFP